jgi:unsaturated rhamnogalacturonyl hydrolase
MLESFVKQIMKDFKFYKESWNYEDGCIYKGIMDMYYATGDKDYYDFVFENIEKWIDKDGKIKNYEISEYNIDNLNSGKVLFPIYKKTKEKKYETAIKELYEQIKTHPRTIEKNFWHKKIYPNQVWLDGLYMALPFYLEYENIFDNKKNYDDIFDQILNVEKHMKDKKTGLYYHGYDESKTERWSDSETGLSQNFWSRAMGWYVMALIDVLEITDDKYEKKEKVKEIFRNTIDALINFQDNKSGMWYQVIDKGENPKNYTETSGTLMIAYSILKGCRLGILEEKYEKSGSKAFQGTVEKYLSEKEGKIFLGGICGVAGLGNDPYRDGSEEYYYSERLITNDAKGTGPFLMAYSEIIYKQNKF